MSYVALSFWLLVIVFAAAGVHRLWCGLIPARALDILLLPGTLAARLGHRLGLLLTGARVGHSAPYSDAPGGPAAVRSPQPRIPVLGPLIVGLLPLLACATALYFVAAWLGKEVMARVPDDVVGPALPATVPALFNLLRELVSLVEELLNAVRSTNFGQWQAALFLYLLVCLTIRTAPAPGTMRGTAAVIVLVGVGGALLSRMLDSGGPRIPNGWALLNLALAMLLLLLLLSLLVRGAIGLFRTLAQNA